MLKLTGYKSGHYSYNLHFILKGGKTFDRAIWVDSRNELLKYARGCIEEIREWGWCEEIERVYATRYDCTARPERVRREAA